MPLLPLLNNINWAKEFIVELRQLPEDLLTAFMAGVLVLTEPDNNLILDSELANNLKSAVDLTGYENIKVIQPLTILEFFVPYREPWMKIIFSLDGARELVLLNVIDKPDTGSPQKIIQEATHRYIKHKSLFFTEP